MSKSLEERAKEANIRYAPILVIGYPNDRVRGKIRELHQKFNLPRSAFINVGLDVQKIIGMRGASYVDVGIANLDYDRQYEVVKQYIAQWELIEFKEGN